MNCAKCGSPLAPGAVQCPMCGEPVSGYGYPQGYAQQPQGGMCYPQQPQAAPGYQQQQPYPPAYPGYNVGYSPYQQGQSMPGYQQPYIYGQTPPREKGSFLTALSDLPHAFVQSFRQPGDLLRSLVEKRDRLSAPIVSAIVLLLTFLGGMVIVRSFVGLLFALLSALGASLAGDSASLNQGITYITGRIAPAVGGIAALCQLLSIFLTALVFMVYLCLVRKVVFSWELAFGLITVTTLPTAAFALLAMLLSLLSPYLALLAIFCGMAVSYVQACGVLSPVTGLSDSQLLPAKITLVCIALTLNLAAAMVVGGLLMGRVAQTVTTLLYSVGSLL